MSMDENVVFDNSQPAQTEEAQEVPAADSGQETAPAAEATDQAQPVEGQEGTEAATTDQQATDETGEAAPALEEGAGGEEPPAEEAPPPPPPFGLSFLQNPLIRKVLIGVGVVFLLFILILIFMPRGKQVKDVKLSWWGLWEDENVVNAIITDFESKNPHIQISYVKQVPDQYRDRLLSRIQNNTGPDVFRYHNTWYPMLSNVLLPLSTDVITPDDFKKTYYPVVQKDLVQNGGIYGIPMGMDTLEMFVNTDLLDSAGAQVPTNWDDFLKVATKLTVKDSSGKITTAGGAMGTFDNISHAPDIISALFAQQGVNMQKFPTEAKNTQETLDFYTSFAKGDTGVWANNLDSSVLAFAKGNLAMYFGFSWDVFTIQQINKNLKFKIYPIPALYGNNTTIASYWAEGVSAKSQNQKEAMLFMHYLAQKETAQKLYSEEAKTRTFGEPYARVDLAGLLKANPLVYPFVENANKASSSFFASDTHDGDGGLNFVSNNYLGNTINSIIVDNNSSETAVETLDQGISQVFQKYGIGQQASQ